MIFREIDEEFNFEPFSWVKNFILCQQLLVEFNELKRLTDFTQQGNDSLLTYYNRLTLKKVCNLAFYICCDQCLCVKYF